MNNINAFFNTFDFLTDGVCYDANHEQRFCFDKRGRRLSLHWKIIRILCVCVGCWRLLGGDDLLFCKYTIHFI